MDCAHQPGTVLIVDDDARTRDMLRLLFEEDGYQVATAPDGCAALDYMRTCPHPVVVLLDWWMPGLTGRQFLEAIAKERHLPHQHAYIILTANATIQRELQDAEPAMLPVSVLMKPVNIDDLLRVVQTAARHLTPAAPSTHTATAHDA